MQKNAELEKLYSKYCQESSEDGRSMIEMLGVLAIVGVLSVGGLAGYTMAMERFKATKSIDQIQKLVTNIKTLYESQRDYDGISVATLIQADVLTSDMLNSTNDGGLNVYDGAIDVLPASANKTFTVDYAGLPKGACSKLATVDWGSSGSGLTSIRVTGGTTEDRTYTWSDAANPLPISLTNALDNCDGLSDNQIIWEFN
ncbi:MAG: hypothetical protein GY804_01555 [Alphaproteobacteria bacterium]|nr:hypothetical protein [Alphaproteobacteria bacterium]